MSFTAEELRQAIENPNQEDYDDYECWWEAEWYFEGGKEFQINGETVTVNLESYDSGLDPDYTDNYKTNIEIILNANGRLFRKTGYHQSFSGGEFDGPFEEVKPVEKTVTVYEGV